MEAPPLTQETIKDILTPKDTQKDFKKDTPHLEKFKKEIQSLFTFNEEEYTITMSQYDDNLKFKVVMEHSLNTWEIVNSLEYFKINKAFTFADSIDEVYEGLEALLKEKNFTILKNGNLLSLSFNFIVFNKNFNFILELNYIHGNISIEMLNQVMNEVKNLRNEIKETKIKGESQEGFMKEINKIQEMLQFNVEIQTKQFEAQDKKIDAQEEKIKFLEKKIENQESLIDLKEKKLIKLFRFLGMDPIVKFKFSKKTVYCYKVDAQKDINDFKNFNQINGLDWFTPDSSKEVNEVIEYFHLHYSKHNLEQLGWIITYGVTSDPLYKKIGNFVINADGYGFGLGDDGIVGRCNGSGFTAFRKGGDFSFANPNIFGKFCNWDSNYKKAIILLQAVNE
jgi:hypothetical protein